MSPPRPIRSDRSRSGRAGPGDLVDVGVARSAATTDDRQCRQAVVERRDIEAQLGRVARVELRCLVELGMAVGVGRRR